MRRMATSLDAAQGLVWRIAGASKASVRRRGFMAGGLCTAALLVAGLATETTAAHAAPKWSKHRVTYCDKTPWPTTVRRVVWRFNQLPVRMHLERTRCRANTDIVVQDVHRTDVKWAGLARPMLYGERIVSAHIFVNRAAPSYRDIDHRFDTLSHELMHALGVPHLSTPCSVVPPSGGLMNAQCDNTVPDGQVRCGPQFTDVMALFRRYGGYDRVFPGTFCPIAYGFDGK